MNQDCVFCGISSGEIPGVKIYENANFFSIPDANPKVKGHSLVISKKHFKTILDLPASLGQEFIDCIKKTSVKLIGGENASGFNLISNNFESAGQVVHHLHIHIIPRRNGDGLSLIA